MTLEIANTCGFSNQKLKALEHFEDEHAGNLVGRGFEDLDFFIFVEKYLLGFSHVKSF